MGLWNRPTIPGKITPGNHRIPGLDRLNQIVKKTQIGIRKIELPEIEISKTQTPKIKIQRKK